MAIQYFLTDVGRDIALNATSLGLNVSLSHIGVGTAKYDPLTELDRTALVAEVERYPLNGGGVEPNSHTLRFVTSIEPTITVDGFEIGIFTDTGTLFAIASTTGNDPLIRLVANIVAISSFGMILSTLDLTNLIITVDPNTPICVALMNQHLDHPNPHPQYSKKIDTDAALLALRVTTITAGAGLTGGGDLSENRTVTLGTPSTITSGSGNEASGSTHTHELGDGSVTDEKIQSVSASKITGIIPSGNLPPASATINVIDNLTSNSVNDALSANQGRVLAEQLVTNAKLADGAVSTSKIADGAVTNDKIVSVDYSKITNTPTQGVATPVVDNLTSVSTTSALSANQGRVLAQQITSKFNSTGGTITGPTYLFTGEDSVSLKMDGVLHIGYQLLFRNESTNQTEFSIGTINDSVVMLAYDRKLIFEAERYDYLDSEGGWFQHTANAGKEKYNFHTDCNVFEFDKDVYFGSVQKAANGYTTLPNGLIMQWGRGQITNDGDVVFPIAFPNSLVNVQVTNDAGGSISHGYNWSLSDKTKFRCTAQSGETLNYSYIALGY